MIESIFFTFMQKFVISLLLVFVASSCIMLHNLIDSLSILDADVYYKAIEGLKNPSPTGSCSRGLIVDAVKYTYVGIRAVNSVLYGFFDLWFYMNALLAKRLAQRFKEIISNDTSTYVEVIAEFESLKEVTERLNDFVGPDLLMLWIGCIPYQAMSFSRLSLPQYIMSPFDRFRTIYMISYYGGIWVVAAEFHRLVRNMHII
jgi:hypothetical protein